MSWQSLGLLSVELVTAVESKIMEKFYNIPFNKSHICDLHQLLDIILDRYLYAIDNPETEEELSLSREVRVGFADRAMNLFSIVDDQVAQIIQEDEV